MKTYLLEVVERAFKRVSIRARSKKEAIRQFREGIAYILDENIVDVEQDIE